MDIRVGDKIDIRCASFMQVVEVTVVDLHVMLDDTALRCIVYIRDSDNNESSVGIHHLARWVENAKKG